MEEDGFVLVKRRGKHSKAGKTSHSCVSESVDSSKLKPIETDLSEKDIERVSHQIKNHKHDITTLNVWTSITRHLTSITNTKNISQIVCYGLGSLLSGPSTFSSRHQLAFLLALKDTLSVEVVSYDPVFNKQDLYLLQSFGIQTLTGNDYGKRMAASRTLFFMPRCPFELFNNLLWKNWNNLDNLILFGNDLTFLDTQLSSKDFEQRLRFIFDALPLLCTEKLCFSDSFLDTVMNNCVIHSFSKAACMHFGESELAALEPCADSITS